MQNAVREPLLQALRDAKLKSSRWLDLRGVCESLLKPHQELVVVRYFTSIVRNKSGAERQNVYLDAALRRRHPRPPRPEPDMDCDSPHNSQRFPKVRAGFWRVPQAQPLALRRC